MDYGKVSRRWMMPAKYYTKVFNHKGTTVRVIFLDTTPLIDSYRKNPEIYPDACKQDAEAQLCLATHETLKNCQGRLGYRGRPSSDLRLHHEEGE